MKKELFLFFKYFVTEAFTNKTEVNRVYSHASSEEQLNANINANMLTVTILTR